MSINSAALKLGLHIVQAKLGQAMGNPGFNVLNENPMISELPLTSAQVRSRSAKVQAPKVITTR